MEKKEKVEKLLSDIVYCENIAKVLNNNCSSPCQKIIKSQENNYSISLGNLTDEEIKNLSGIHIGL